MCLSSNRVITSVQGLNKGHCLWGTVLNIRWTLTRKWWQESMIPGQREALILEMIEQHGMITVDEICTHCNCSKETARRDLRRLAERDLVVRTHGGAQCKQVGLRESEKLPTTSLLAARAALLDRVDVLIVTPSDTMATRVLVERSRRAGVPIVAEAMPYPGMVSAVFVDNYRAGLQLGLWVADYVRQHYNGRISVLDISLPQTNTQARSRGFADGLRGIPAKDKTIYRVDGRGNRDASRLIALDALAVQPDINVIFGINDVSAMGGLDAIHELGLEESRFLVVCTGLEGKLTRDLMIAEGPFQAAVAMFPEVVGRACIDAAVCAFNKNALPERIYTPFAVVTAETLHEYYTLDSTTGEWQVEWSRVDKLPNVTPQFITLLQCKYHTKPARIGYIHPFGAHEWYQNVCDAMRSRAGAHSISIEIIDASLDEEKETEALKRAIGRAAARFVQEGDTIVLDSGDTIMYLAQALCERCGITVVTNSIPVLQILTGCPGISLISSGGHVQHQTRSLVGDEAERRFWETHADKVFVGTVGVSVAAGISNINLAEAAVKRAMIAAGRMVFLLADYTKIGVESLVRVAPIESITCVITSAGISPYDRNAFMERGVDVWIAYP
ncbi:MAG: substrate-binding domain-containing protein [Anaerolineae bacterium]|nr:substrate-binding domain-containing protein [Anaerolineae bacterium]